MAASWAAVDRPKTQNDPTTASRAFTLFDEAGEHDPIRGPGWSPVIRPLHDDPDLVSELDAYGIVVTGEPDPAVVRTRARTRSPVTLGDLADAELDQSVVGLGSEWVCTRPRTMRRYGTRS